MKTAIIGAGAIGSLFGSLMKKGNCNPVLYDRDSSKTDYINRNGISLVYAESGNTLKVFPEAVSSLSRIKDCDYYLVCVKSYSTEAAAGAVSETAGSNSVVVTFQNGMGNVDILRKYFPDSRIAAGTTSEGALFRPPGTLVYAGKGETALSIIESGSSNALLDPLINALNRSGLKTSVSENYRKDIWRKLIVNAVINPVTAVLRLQNRHIADSVYLRDLAEMIISESVKAAAADGIYFDTDEIRDAVFTIAVKTGENRSSMLQDIENGRKTEIDYISGAAADKAEESGIIPSVNRVMQNIVKVLENRYFT